ncbi:bucky ball [Synchiropus picturatus]
MAAIIGPPAHPAPALPHPRSNSRSSEPSAGQQDHHINQEPPPHPQHHLPPRPVYYVQAPPPPPFLPYQWPVSFPFNPFMGFPGIGYSMVMPPFLPPPYIDAPAYVMPHPHLQPVDYRRFFQPPLHAPMAPHQNPYQTRRVRPQQPVIGRETVNSEVQTEPTRRDVTRYSPVVGSDSGQGTASSSPSSSSSRKRFTEVANLTSPTCNTTDAVEVKRKLIDVQSVQKDLQSNVKPSLEMQIGQFGSTRNKNGHFNIWSVSSTESLNPVCSSSQREDVTGKERRHSVPDILMSWGGGTPQAETIGAVDNEQPQTGLQQPSCETEGEKEKCDDPNPTEMGDEDILAQASSTQCHEDQMFNGSETHAAKPVNRENAFMKTLHCIEAIQEGNHDENSVTLPKDTTETLAFIPFSSYQTKPKLNESVWSVESLAPFIPSKEWMLQNSTSEMLKMTKESEVDYPVLPKNDGQRSKCRPRRLSPSKSPVSSMSPKVVHQMTGPNIDVASDLLDDILHHLKDHSGGLSPASLLPKFNTNGSSEPVASKSPNQETSILIEQLTAPLELKQMSAGHCNHSSPLEIIEPQKQQERLQLIVPASDQHDVSPSKKDLVDCGVQCTDLQFCPCQDPTMFNMNKVNGLEMSCGKY